MGPSGWTCEQIERLAHHHRIVWVEDPYGLIEPPDLHQLELRLRLLATRVIVVRSAFRLREALAQFDPDSPSATFVMIDQSYRLRDPHLLPKDAKPVDLVPLPAPDWKPKLPPDAIFRPTIRDFLVDATEDESWPSEVNIYPYEKLARENAEAFIRSYETFRRTGRALTSDDLVMVGASAVFGLDLFEINDPITALEVAFHSEERWAAIAQYFNDGEREVIRGRLQESPKPLGDLFSDAPDNARLAVIAMVVLQQHALDDPGKALAALSPALSPYVDCWVPSPTDLPAWFLEHEVIRFDKFVGNDFLKYLRATLKLDEPSEAQKFAQAERLSSKLRSQVPFQLQVETARQRHGDADFAVDRLVPEFMQLKTELAGLVATIKPAVERLRLTAPKQLKATDVIRLLVEQGFYRVDHLSGRLESLMYYVETPARPRWSQIEGFEKLWSENARQCRDLIHSAGKLRDDLDYQFGRLLESRYGEVVPEEFLPADLFYQEFIVPRRRSKDGKLRKAIVLLFDSMRFDIWRQLVRPLLETDYSVEEKVGFALLPSETRVSRRSFFAGKPPAAMRPSGRESDFFAECLERQHGSNPKFEDLPKRPGMAFGVRARDDLTAAYVFDFADMLSHEVDWDPHTLQETLKPLMREVRAVLSKAGPETLVFVTADHGHIRQDGSPVRIPGADDVGYRSAYVDRRVEGSAAAHVFQIPARTLRHSEPGWFIFPKPGYALRDDRDAKRFKPGASYRHGGISLFEVTVPLVCLTHREAKAEVRLVAKAPESATVGVTTHLQVSVSTDGMISSPVTLVADDRDVEPVVLTGIEALPRAVVMRFTPSTPGKRTISVSAHLAEQEVGAGTVDVHVAPAAPARDEAREKLARLFGDE